jgi:hypothetical protein
MKGKISASSLITTLALLLAHLTQAINLQAGQSEWTVYSSKEGGFSILMPGMPKEQVSTQEVPNMGTAQIHLFVVRHESGFYMASYVDYPPLAKTDQENADSFGKGFLRSVGQGIAQGAKGKVVKETEINFGAYPGREILIELPAGLLTARAYFIKRRGYQLIAGPSTPGAENGNIKKFLDSFRVD